MATLDKRELATRVLEYLSVVPLGQAPSGEHLLYVETAIDSAYDRLQDPGLAPYGIEDIPSWAHEPMTRFIAAEVGAHFGKALSDTVKSVAKQEMAASVFGGPRAPLPAKATGY